MVIDSFQKRFVMNMQFRQCFSRAKPFRLKKARKSQILSVFFYFQKSQRCSKKPRILKSGFKKATLATLIMAVRTSATFKLSLFPDNDLSWSIPHTVKCRTGAVNNLSRSREICTMLKVILSKLKFIQNLRISDTTSNYVSASIWLCLPSNMKSSSHKTWQRHFLFWNLSIYKILREKYGKTWRIISPLSKENGGTSFVSPPPNFAHEATCSKQHD